MASAARTVRSESFSCAIGCPNRAINPSPSVLATRPPICDPGVETGRKAGRSDKIAEHHGDGAALGRNLGGFGPQGEARCQARLHRKRRGSQLPDCDEQPAPITDGRDANPPEVFRRYMTENVLVDPVLAKGRRILVETELAKPPAEVHGRAPHRFQG